MVLCQGACVVAHAVSVAAGFAAATAMFMAKQTTMMAAAVAAGVTPAVIAIVTARFTAITRAPTPRAAAPVMAHKSIHRTTSAAADQRNAGQQGKQYAFHERGLPFHMLRTCYEPGSI